MKMKINLRKRSVILKFGKPHLRIEINLILKIQVSQLVSWESWQAESSNLKLIKKLFLLTIIQIILMLKI